MHDTALEIGSLFFKKYITKPNPVILDVGSLNVNGSLRSVAPPNCKYIGIDIEIGKGVDVVLNDPYVFPFTADYFDAVVCTSVFEHDCFFWQTFVEIIRVLKVDGFLYINSPSNGKYHAYPHDFWRFYPDSALALKSWVGKSGTDISLIESFTAKRKTDRWNDAVMIFRKGVYEFIHYNFIHKDFPAYNIRTVNSTALHNPTVETEDQLIIDDLGSELSRYQELHKEQLEIAGKAIEAKLTIESEKRVLEEMLLKEKSEIDRLSVESQKKLDDLVDSFDKQIRNQSSEYQEALNSIREKIKENDVVASKHKIELKRQMQVREELEEKIKKAETQEVWLVAQRNALAKGCSNLSASFRSSEGLLKETVRKMQAAEAENSQLSHNLEITEVACEKLYLQINKLRGTTLALQKENSDLHRELGERLREREKLLYESDILKKIIESAKKWQKRSIFKRMFHRWRAKMPKAPDTFDLETHSKDSLSNSGPLNNGTESTSEDFVAWGKCDQPKNDSEIPYQPNPLFDAKWYLTNNPGLIDIDPEWHFINLGWKEGRDPCLFFNTEYYLSQSPDLLALDPLRHYLERGGFEGLRPIPEFDSKWYLSTYIDVLTSAYNPLLHYVLYGAKEGRNPNAYVDSGFYASKHPEAQGAALKYYLESGLKNGWGFVPLPVLGLPCWGLPPVINRKLVVVIHSYYVDNHPDVTSQILSKLRNIPIPYSLYISTDSERKKQIIRSLCERQGVKVDEIRIVPNRGRDIAPKYLSFRDVLQRSEWFLLLHDKISFHINEGGHHWRTFLLDTLIGSSECVTTILHFLSDPRVGVVFPNYFYPYPTVDRWIFNRKRAELLMERMDIEPSRWDNLEFPAGSMYWGKVAAIQPLLDLDLSLDEFEEELGQTDGTLAHAIERLPCLLAAKVELASIKVSGAIQPDEVSYKFIHSLSHLELFIKEAVDIQADLLLMKPKSASIKLLKDRVPNTDRSETE